MRCNFDEPISLIHSLDGVEILFRWGGWGWLEIWGLKLTSAKVVVGVEAELGNMSRNLVKNVWARCMRKIELNPVI